MAVYLLGCSPEEQSSVPTERLTTQSTNDGKCIEIYDTHLYDLLQLNDDEELSVLDVKENILLCTVDREYTEDDPYHRYEGNNASTLRLFLYDISDHVVKEEITFDKGEFCIDAVIMDDSIIYALVTMDSATKNEVFSCWIATDDETLLVHESNCTTMGEMGPYLVVLGGTTAAFSFYDPHTGNFGFSLISAEGREIPILNCYDNDETTMLWTELVSNGDVCVYFYGKNSESTFVICDKNGNATECAIDNRVYRIYNYAILENSLVFSAQDISVETEKIKQIIIEVDFGGNIIKSLDHKALYRLQSDGNNYAMGIDMSYQVYLVASNMNQLDITEIDIESVFPEGRAVLFASGKSGQFFLNYRYERALFLVLLSD